MQCDDRGQTVSATFAVGSLLLRFVRERGEDFLDVASAHEPEAYCQADDVALAFGWKTLDAVLEQRAPEPLPDVLARLHDHGSELTDAFDAQHRAATMPRLEQARPRRTRAFEARLR